MALSEGQTHAIQAASVHAMVELLGSSAEGSHVVSTHGLTASIVPAAPDDPTANVVHGIGPAYAMGLDEVHDMYLGAKVREWSVWVGPESEVARDFLYGRGYDRSQTLAAMTLDLTQLPVRRRVKPPYLIQAVEMATIAQLNGAAHDAPGILHALTRLPRGEHVRTYGVSHLAEVMSALLTIDVPSADGEADCTIGFVATLPERQRQGYAKRAMIAALLDARHRGCRTAVLQATPEGVQLYRKLGFQDAGHYDLFRRR